MAQANGCRLFEGLYTVLNEYGEIRLQIYVQSTSNEQLREPLQQMAKTIEILGFQPPKVFFVDNCCQSRSFLHEVLPSLQDNIAILPILEINSYRGQPIEISVAETPKTALMHATALHDIVDSLPAQSKIVGLDLEWNISYSATPSKVALLQVAVQGTTEGIHVFLFNLYACGIKARSDFPGLLLTMLEDPSVIKAGSRITSSDAPKLQRDFGVTLCGAKELAPLCAQKGYICNSKASLRNMTISVLKRDLPKDRNGPRTSTWEVTKLKKEQREYGARDALASLLVYLEASQNTADLMLDSGTTETSSQPPLTASPGKPLTYVKLDALHAMKRILERVPRNHPMAIQFALALRDAIFVVNPDDRNNIHRVLLQISDTFENAYNCRSDWILERVRRIIPAKEELRRRLVAVRDRYLLGDFTDPTTNLPTLNKEAQLEFEKLLKHVDLDCLSDPPDCALYFIKGKDKDGLNMYRCVRGTSDIEGIFLIIF